MQPRHWHSLVFAAAISLVGVAAVLSLPVSAQTPHSLPSTSNARIANTLVGCVAMINGGFETGSFAPWVIDGITNTPVITSTQAHSGAYSALLGTRSGAEPLGNSSFFQQITVPAAGGSLSFWYWPYTVDTVTFDWQDAYVTDSSGIILATIFHQASNAQTWIHVTFDLTPYASQTVRIKFLVHEDGIGDDTAMYVDDVALTPPCVQFSTPAYPVNENGGTAAITVTLTSASVYTATVKFATSDGTAKAGIDYAASSGTLVFPPGVTSQTFSVPIIDDNVLELNESFNVVLSAPLNAALGYPASAVVTIIEDNTDPAPPLVCGALGPWLLRNFLPIPVYGAGVSNDGTYAYAVGGYSFQTAGDVTQNARYNPLTNVWSLFQPVPDAFSQATAVYAPINNKLYVFGGEVVTTARVLTTTRIYDVAGNSWSTGAPLPDRRAFMGGGYYNGKIYLVSGYSTGNVSPAYAQTWEYDVLADTWLTKTAMPQALGGAASAVANGHLYIIGGRTPSNTLSSQTYDYNIAGDTWFTRTDMPVGLNVSGAAVRFGNIWVIGGGNPFLAQDRPAQLADVLSPQTTNATQIYHPAGDSWSAGPNLNLQRSFVGATGFGNFAVAIGGYDGSSTTGATEVTCFPSVYLPLVIKNH